MALEYKDVKDEKAIEVLEHKELAREVNAINTCGEWEKITMAADSGAVDHVIRKDEAPSVQLQETAASKAGMCYGSKWNRYCELRRETIEWTE